MKLRALLVLAGIALAHVGAIDHDTVEPFAQPEPATNEEEAAVMFKPSLDIKTGCQPYPAVNAAGETSGGLKGTGEPDSDCEGSDLGSQVYSRAMEYSGKWAIMYAWYFPKDIVDPIPFFIPLFKSGSRHRWLHMVIWLDDVNLEEPTVLAISSQAGIEKPVQKAHLNGLTPQMAVEDNLKGGYHQVVPTVDTGKFQDLIQWEQMTDEARKALETTDFSDDFNENKVPFIDAYFEDNLRIASTYYVYVRRRHSEPHSIWESSGSNSSTA